MHLGAEALAFPGRSAVAARAKDRRGL